MTPEERVAHGVTEGPAALVEACVSYQRMGDGPGEEWARLVLAEAEGDDDIEPGWQVLGEWRLSWVQVIVFTFRVHMPADENGAVPAESAQSWAHEMAAHIVGEDDVCVLGVKVVDQ